MSRNAHQARPQDGEQPPTRAPPLANPFPYPDGGVESFAYTLNVAGVTSYTNQLGTNVVNYTYDPLGRKITEIYPGIATNSFTYDGVGHLLTLTDGKNQVTAWHYDQYGRATNKVDATSTEILRYAYDPNNRLTNRWSAAKGNTAYSFDPVGNLLTINYPHSGTINYSFDLLNRVTNMVDAVGTTAYGYTSAGLLSSEDGPWNDDTVSYSYNYQRLRNGLSVLAPNASPWAESYGYDGVERLTNLTSPAGAFGYGYDATRHTQVASLTLPDGAYLTNTFDPVARLLSTVLRNSTNGVINAHQYAYNIAGQRTWLTNTAGDYRNYLYDNVGQLTAALGSEPGGTKRWQEQLGYRYDPAGNLNFRTNNELLQTFTLDTLNELAGVSRTPNMTVAGTTTSAATNVTVNTLTAALYGDNTFAQTNVGLADGNNTFTAIAKDALGRSDTNTASCYLPATNSFSYDLNGNLLSDGNRNFSYDDENQLTSVWVTNTWRSDFVYDGKMRRRIRREYTWSFGAWLQTNAVRYICDGNLVIQERDANNLPTVSYTRGRDLSGTLQGAGGIGGLLARTDHGLSAINSPLSTAFYHADGNGNITCLINTNQAIVAKYLYDPFGNILSKIGPLADANLYRFSSQEWHQNSGLVYYLYRLYDPNLQRWLNRDPAGEESDLNLYRHVDNNPLNIVDPYGLDWQIGPFSFGQPPTYMNPNGTLGFGTPPSEQAPSDPNTYGAMRGSLIGDPNDNNFGGQTGGQVVADIGKSIVENASLAALGALGPGEEEGAYAAIDKLNNLRRCPKPVNLPKWKKIGVDMEHILSGHTAEGIRAIQSGQKDIFPEWMTPNQIEDAIRQAYRYGQKVESQGDRVLVSGPFGQGTIQMWVNTATKTIESAWPK